MRLRSQLALTVFSVGALGLVILILDQAAATRSALYGRAEARAQALSESAAQVALPLLKGERLETLERALRDLARLPSVSYLVVEDSAGEHVFAAGMGAGSAGREVSADVREGARSYGAVRIGLSLEGLREAIRTVMWRGLALGLAGLVLLALLSGRAGELIGGRLERLVDAVEGWGGQPGARLPDSRKSEVDRLGAAFDRLLARLRAEEGRRAELESLREDLTHMMVHDLKHPLTVLKAALALIGPQASEPVGLARAARAMSMAQRATDRLNAMLEDLLAVAAIEHSRMPMRRARLRVDRFFEQRAEEGSLMAEQARREFRVVREPEATEGWVYGDPDLLARVVGNLVLNAIDHTPSGTPITLGLRRAGKTGAQVAFFVRDSGPGVPPARVDAIFRKFTSYAACAKNLGLGLAFCRMVAEHHKGRLDLESAPGEGATFSLILPVHATQEDEGSPSAAGAGAGRERA